MRFTIFLTGLSVVVLSTSYYGLASLFSNNDTKIVSSESQPIRAPIVLASKQLVKARSRDEIANKLPTAVAIFKQDILEAVINPQGIVANTYRELLLNPTHSSTRANINSLMEKVNSNAFTIASCKEWRLFAILMVQLGRVGGSFPDKAYKECISMGIYKFNGGR